jgi:Tfp pilus assembly protein PilP
MKPSSPTSILRLSTISLLLLLLAVAGCSSSGSADLETQMNGQWKNPQGGMVDIKLVKDAASLTIDGHVFPAVVEKVDKMANTVQLKVKTDAGASEEWSLHQMWNDNRSDFRLTLRRNGSSETLTPISRS